MACQTWNHLITRKPLPRGASERYSIQSLSKKVLITGVGGQDGHFLARLLLERGDTVHGLLRGGSEDEIGSLKYLGDATLALISIHRGDVTEKWFIDELIQRELFDQVFHLAAQSSVARSIEHPRATIDTNVLGLTNIATSIRDRSPETKLLFTGSSEMFGNLTEGKQSERTPRHPQSPYGLTKDFGFQLINAYREHYGLWAATAILFNHESEFRGEQFVTKKIIQSVARIAGGEDEILCLGNIYAERDWGYAGDYMEGVLDVMALDRPDDFVFATGQLHSVKDFVNLAFKQTGIEPEWSGEGLEEIARDPSSGKVIVKIDERFYRPGDIKGTCGDADKAKQILDWQAKTDLDAIIERMLRHEQDSVTK